MAKLMINDLPSRLHKTSPTLAKNGVHEYGLTREWKEKNLKRITERGVTQEAEMEAEDGKKVMDVIDELDVDCPAEAHANFKKARTSVGSASTKTGGSSSSVKSRGSNTTLKTDSSMPPEDMDDEQKESWITEQTLKAAKAWVFSPFDIPQDLRK